MKTDPENEPRQMSWLVFRNSPPGPPIIWVPFVFFPPRILHRATVSRPHPFVKGRGGWGCILTCEGAEAVEVEPTSLNGGEGLVAESKGEVGVENARTGVVVERWWWTKESEIQP